MTTTPLKVFVYGTLKRGFPNHPRYCKGVLEVQEATVRGRLYVMPQGYPALEMPGGEILAAGTNDPVGDLHVQHEIQPPPYKDPGKEWDLVQGEILTFGDPPARLPRLDRLEGYVPENPSHYRRVLVRATLKDDPEEVVYVWTYVMDKPKGDYLPGGVWPAGEE